MRPECPRCEVPMVKGICGIGPPPDREIVKWAWFCPKCLFDEEVEEGKYHWSSVEPYREKGGDIDHE